MVEQEEGGSPVRSFGCLTTDVAFFQCRDTGNDRLQRILECCNDQSFCNKKLSPTLPPRPSPPLTTAVTAPTQTGSQPLQDCSQAALIGVAVGGVLLLLLLLVVLVVYVCRRQDRVLNAPGHRMNVTEDEEKEGRESVPTKNAPGHRVDMTEEEGRESVPTKNAPGHRMNVTEDEEKEGRESVPTK